MLSKMAWFPEVRPNPRWLVLYHYALIHLTLRYPQNLGDNFDLCQHLLEQPVTPSPFASFALLLLVPGSKVELRSPLKIHKPCITKKPHTCRTNFRKWNALVIQGNFKNENNQMKLKKAEKHFKNSRLKKIMFY